MIKLYIYCPVLIIGNVEVGLDIGMKFHQEVMEIVSYDTNDRLIRKYWMVTRAHERYNRLFRQTHKTFQIHHLALLMSKDYITILVGTLQ